MIDLTFNSISKKANNPSATYEALEMKDDKEKPKRKKKDIR